MKETETRTATATLAAPPGRGRPIACNRGSTERGIALFRTLVNDETDIAGIDAARHNAACEPLKAD